MAADCFEWAVEIMLFVAELIQHHYEYTSHAYPLLPRSVSQPHIIKRGYYSLLLLYWLASYSVMRFISSLPYNRLILWTNILRFFNFPLFCRLNVCGYSLENVTAHAQNHVLCRKFNFTQINICDFHRHCKLAKFSSSQIFPLYGTSLHRAVG